MPAHAARPPAHAATPPTHPAAEAALWALWRLTAPLAALLAAAGWIYQHTAPRVAIAVTACLALATAVTLAAN